MSRSRLFLSRAKERLGLILKGPDPRYRTDRNIYHLDGPQALRYLDRLLEIPQIHAIQWVPGAGQSYWADWIEVYQRIQSKKRALCLSRLPAKDLNLLFTSLDPEGVWIRSVSGISNEREAEAALHEIAKWTKKR